MDLNTTQAIVTACIDADKHDRESTASRLPTTPESVDALLTIIRRSKTNESSVDESSTASWLLKFLAEQGVDIGTRQVTKLIQVLELDADDWTLLHLLQLLPYLRLNTTQQDKLHARLDALLARKHKFVRAWTFNGFGVLAATDARWRADTLERFERAMQTEPASVRARIRNVMRELEAS